MTLPDSRIEPATYGTPLQYSCLGNPMDGGAWWAAVYGVTQSRTRLKRLSSSSSSMWLLQNRHSVTGSWGEGNGNPLQCFCLENPRDGKAWWAAVYGVAQSRTRLKRLSSSSSGIFCVLHILMLFLEFLLLLLLSRFSRVRLCMTP